MSNGPIAEVDDTSPHASRRRWTVAVVMGIVALIAVSFFVTSQPNAAEKKLIGIWKSRVAGADNSEVIRLGSNFRLTGFDSASGEFRHDEGYWSVVDGQLKVERSVGGPRLFRILSNIYLKISGTAAGRIDMLYDIEWDSDDRCRIIWTDRTLNETPLTIELERIENFDPSVWDERGVPTPSATMELR